MTKHTPGPWHVVEGKLTKSALEVHADNRKIRPLTDDEIHALSRVHWNHQSNQLDYIKFARAIEEILGKAPC